jgi:hypothetical protein
VSGKELLARSLTAHGGVERWDEVEEIAFDLVSGGLAMVSHGQRELRTRAVVSTREPRVVLSPYRQWFRAVYTRNRVLIEDRSGCIVAERSNPRASMGHGRRLLWWDPLDALYFVGYALSTYVRAPFLFVQEGFHVEAEGSLEWNGNRWDMLRVTFPPDEPTHCQTQVYYLNDQGLIQRLDYLAEPIGRWAHAAQFCTEYRDVGGLRVATRRWVLPRTSSGVVWLWPRLMCNQINGMQLMC